MRSAWVAVALLGGLLALPIHPAQDASLSAVTLDDPEDDTGYRPSAQFPNVPVRGFGAVDLTRLDARFVEEGLRVEARFRGLQVGGADFYPDDWSLSVRMGLADSDCRLKVLVRLPASVARGPVGLGLALKPEPAWAHRESLDSTCPFGAPLRVHIEPSGGTVHFVVPWAYLSDAWNNHFWQKPPFDLTTVPTAITDLQAVTGIRTNAPFDYFGLTGYFPVTDGVPDVFETSPQRLPLPRPWPNAGLAISVAPFSRPFYGEPGYNHSLTFAVQNRLPHATVVRLNYTFAGDADDVARASVVGPPSLRLPAGQTRNYTLFAQRAADSGPVALDIWAEALPGGQVGVDRIVLDTGDSLGPEKNTLHFAARSLPVDESYEAALLCPESADLDPVRLSCRRHVLLSHAVRPPEYVVDGEVPLDVNAGTQSYYSWTVVRPLALPRAGPVQVDLPLRFDRPARQVEVELGLSYIDGQGLHRLMDRKEERDLLTEPERFEFRVASARDLLLEGQGSFRLDLQIRTQVLPLEPTSRAWLDLERARITLPLIEVPPEHVEPVRPVPFQVQVRSEKHEFVNPGESRLFRLEILNIDNLEHRVTLTADSAAPGWTFDAQPGDVFILPPGAGVNVGLLASATADAPEGTQATIFVNATGDDGLQAGVRLTAIVVHEVELEDDRGNYAAQEEDLAFVEKRTTAATPGPGAAALAAGLVFLLWRARRRTL